MAAQKSVSEMNREYWSGKDQVYETDDWKGPTLQWSEEVRTRREWMNLPARKGQRDAPVRLLDFACGPGMASHALWDFVDSARGIDVADGMVAKYNARAAEAGLSAEQMSAVRADLLAADPAASEPAIQGDEFFDFDVAVVANAMHHFEDPKLAVERLVGRLKPGGVLVVLDWPIEEGAIKELIGAAGGNAGDWHHGHGHGHQQQQHQHHHNGHGHGHGHDNGADEQKIDLQAVRKTITHHGFKKGEMVAMLKDAGCVDVEYELMEKPIKMPASLGGFEKKSFLARGIKAAEH